MRILIISDIHSNMEAIQVINEQCDYIFCLGDIIDYGPDPKFAIDFIKQNSDYTIKGNHDNAISYDMNCRSSNKFRKISFETRQITKTMLEAEDIEFLRFLPITEHINIGHDDFFLVHATPSNPLYHYIDENNEQEIIEQASYINAKYILLGHTHRQWIRKIQGKTLISPGSVGMSKDNPGKACYAVWEDENITLKQIPYDVNKTCEKIRALNLSDDSKNKLINAFTKGRVD